MGHIDLEDGTRWPDPEDCGALEWACRYGTDEAVLANRMAFASVLAAYVELVMRPNFARKPIMIRRVLRRRRWKRATNRTTDKKSPAMGLYRGWPEI